MISAECQHKGISVLFYGFLVAITCHFMLAGSYKSKYCQHFHWQTESGKWMLGKKETYSGNLMRSLWRMRERKIRWTVITRGWRKKAPVFHMFKDKSCWLPNLSHKVFCRCMGSIGYTLSNSAWCSLSSRNLVCVVWNYEMWIRERESPNFVTHTKCVSLEVHHITWVDDQSGFMLVFLGVR